MNDVANHGERQEIQMANSNRDNQHTQGMQHKDQGDKSRSPAGGQQGHGQQGSSSQGGQQRAQESGRESQHGSDASRRK